MKFSDFVVPEAVIPNLSGDSKEETIRTMVASLTASGRSYYGGDVQA